MATQANIVVPDAAATPVNRTFAPQKIVGNIATWMEKTATQPLGWWPLTVEVRDPSAGGTVFRQNLEFSKPELATYTSSSGAPVTVVDRVIRYKLEVIEPVTSTLQERKDARKMFWGMLNDSQVIAVLEGLDRPT